MLLNTEELLALVNGDAEPDRLADLLDRIERCPDSAAALDVLVALRANREEALDALHVAAHADVSSFSEPIPHPSSFLSPPSGWQVQGLRLAASVALVAVVGVWAASSFFGASPSTGGGVVISSLATEQIHNTIEFNPTGVELTANDSDLIAEAAHALSEERYDEVVLLLAGQETDAAGHVPLLLGMSEYALKNYDAAAAYLATVQDLDSADSNVKHQSLWYEANAQLALDSPITAVMLLEQLKSAPAGYRFRDDAEAKDDSLRSALGFSNLARDTQK